MLFLTLLCFLQDFNLPEDRTLDLYEVLGLPHSFTPRHIQRAYRRFRSILSASPPVTDRQRENVADIELAFTILGNPSARDIYGLLGWTFLDHLTFKVSHYISDAEFAFMRKFQTQTDAPPADFTGNIWFPVSFSLADYYRGATKVIYLSGFAPCTEDQKLLPKLTRYNLTLPAGAPAFYPIDPPGDFYNPGVPMSPHSVVFLPMCAPVPNFERVGNDLWTNATITLAEAIAGKALGVKNIDGSTVFVDWSPEIQRGEPVRVPGKGFRDWLGEGAGDLVVRFTVTFPAAIGEDERAALGGLLSDSDDDYE
jgi:DnaJ-class molecular chaperone